MLTRAGHAYAKYAKYADYAHMRNMRMRIENLIHIFQVQRETEMQKAADLADISVLFFLATF